jgi:hypothetical protein
MEGSLVLHPCYLPLGADLSLPFSLQDLTGCVNVMAANVSRTLHLFVQGAEEKQLTLQVRTIAVATV